MPVIPALGGAEPAPVKLQPRVEFEAGQAQPPAQAGERLVQGIRGIHRVPSQRDAATGPQDAGDFGVGSRPGEAVEGAPHDHGIGPGLLQADGLGGNG